MTDANTKLPPVVIETDGNDSSPVRQLSAEELALLGVKLKSLFERYRSDRQPAEQRWLRNLRQYLGYYDPEVEAVLPKDQSRAYPRITRVKVLSVLARIMNLMFPGNEKNWEVNASPSADITPADVEAEMQVMFQLDSEAGAPQKPLTTEGVRRAVQRVAERRAREMEIEIDDQLQEIGGDQTLDYIALVRSVLRSGIQYGPGYLHGPFVRETTLTTWDVSEGKPVVREQTAFAPLFEFISVWDLYPDMLAKSFEKMEGFWVRKVMTRGQLSKLAKRPDFLADQVKLAIKRIPNGNYTPQGFETDLRSMGMSQNAAPVSVDTQRYEVLMWNGQIDGMTLRQIGVNVKDADVAEDMDVEVWMVDSTIIKIDINTWRKLGVKMRTLHTFVFDEDDTSLVGNGLPSIMRDSQMAISAAARMLLDNASVVCGPSLEINHDLLRPDQDTSAVAAYRIWNREGTGQEAQFPAVRNITIDSHMKELMAIIDLFMRFADQETFVGPGAGGEQVRGTAEPMRTAAGASMLRADAALPFKDVVRNFDTFTQSVIQSLIGFNRVFNPRIPKGDFNVIARGATSLIAKEVRGAQMDQLAVSLSPEDRLHVDDRKFVEARFAVRDLQGMLVSPDEFDRRKAAGEQQVAAAREEQAKLSEASLRKVLSEAFKNIALAQSAAARAGATQVAAALDTLERGLEPATTQPQEVQADA